MRTPRRRSPLELLAALAAGLLLAPLSPAEGAFSIPRWTSDSGGTSGAQGGNYTVAGTIGQVDAGTQSSTSYSVTGGFWRGTAGAVIGIHDPDDGNPIGPVTVTRLLAPAPNPVRAATRIAFELAEPRDVAVTIFDVRGSGVRSLHHGPLPAGRYDLEWDARDQTGNRVSSGVYFLLVRLGRTSDSRRLVVIR